MLKYLTIEKRGDGLCLPNPLQAGTPEKAARMTSVNDVVGLDDKREVTMLLGCTMAGAMIPPQVVYQGITDKCHPKFTFPCDWNITHSPSHWSTEETMLEYVDSVLVPYVKSVKKSFKLPSKQKSLLIFDVFAAHRCESFLSVLKKKNFVVRFVPAGCTGELQPLDLSVNGEMKVVLKKEFTNWYSEKMVDQLKKKTKDKIDLRISVMKPVHARWLVKCFDSLSNNVEAVKRGWKKAGLCE